MNYRPKVLEINDFGKPNKKSMVRDRPTHFEGLFRTGTQHIFHARHSVILYVIQY